MHALIVLAHPEQRSFNAYLAELARQAWGDQGHDATVLDLYAEDFEPREASWHYSSLKSEEKFDPMQEQRHHWSSNTLPPVVAKHIELLQKSDALILQFPFWWFGMPAIMKGWMDRVFVYGGLYRSQHRYENGVMRGKKALIVSTAGSSAQACGPDGRDGDMRLLLWPAMHALHYLGFTVLEPYLIHGVRGGLSGKEAQQQRHFLEQRATDYHVRLQHWSTWPSIPFNHGDDFTDGVSLNPDAPVYSPFVRHRLGDESQ